MAGDCKKIMGRYGDRRIGRKPSYAEASERKQWAKSSTEKHPLLNEKIAIIGEADWVFVRMIS
jgi:hypothetical protein